MSLRMPRLSFKSKKVEHYTKVEDSIDLSVSIVQAATMLDEIAEQAIKKGDSETMLAVVAGWMQLGSTFLADSEQEEHPDVEEVLTDTKIMGFASQSAREEMESAKQESKRKAGL